MYPMAIAPLEYNSSIQTSEAGNPLLGTASQGDPSRSEFNPDQYYQELIQQFSYPQTPLNFRVQLRKNPILWREIRKLEEQIDQVWVQFKREDTSRENLQRLMIQLKETLAKGVQFVSNS